MNERIEKELSGLAVKLGKTEEEMLAKYNEIAEANGLDLENERNGMVALTLTRNFARGSLKGNKSSSKKGGFGNDAFGFIVGSEPSRDVQEWKRKNLVSDYTSNSNTVFNEERCAEVVLTEAGYEKSQIIDGEVKTKIIPQLPKSSIEVDEDKWIVPIDNIKSFMNLEYLIIDCLRYDEHPSHFNLREVLDLVKLIKPKKTILTNMHSDLDYAALKKNLPKNIVPGYDGMTLKL